MSEYWQCSSVMYRPSKATKRVALEDTTIPKSNKIIKYSKNGIYYICVLLLVVLTLMQSSELIGSYLNEPTYISTQVGHLLVQCACMVFHIISNYQVRYFSFFNSYLLFRIFPFQYVHFSPLILS